MPRSPREEIVLGIDPGFRQIGWGALRHEKGKFYFLEAGTWSPERANSHAAIQEHVGAALETYRPHRVFIERLYFSQNAMSAMRVAEIRGVIIAEVARRRIPLGELSPTTIKKSLCGYGRAEKSAVSRMVRLILEPAFPASLSDHATDALAIAIAGCLS